MRILLLSDTHIPLAKNKLPAVVENEAKMSDCCIHTGDFIAYPVFETLSRWTTLYAVCGNMDDEHLKGCLPEKQIVRLEGINFGITHGRGSPADLINYLKKAFTENFNSIDVFIFGHSHFPFNEEINGKVYFNPGSATDTVFAPYTSYGIFEINRGRIAKREIIKIE